MEQKGKSTNKFSSWLKSSVTIRMVMVGVLTLILLIPLSYIENLITERQQRQESVVNEINGKWGDEVLIYGPILKVPYKTYTSTVKENAKTRERYLEKSYTVNYLYVFPEKLESESQISPEVKSRGIYNSVVYKGNMILKGEFEKPNFDAIDISEKDVMWNKSKVIIKTSNLKGINNEVKIKINKNKYSFVPKYSKTKKNDYTYSNYKLTPMHKLECSNLIIGDLPDSLNSKFSVNIEFNGSKQIRIIPIGKETSMRIKSDWKSPSFIGNYLPYNSDKIKKNGFDAKWKVLNINRGFAQYFKSTLPDLQEYAFGVNLMLPVDQYQQSTRTAKYGFLVIGLTFLVFFLFQSISKVNIHPFQYLMIGIALTMFYTLLISISEHSSFLIAYLISGISVIILISLYSKSILKQTKFMLLISSTLTAIYTFIYVIIQLESYALLVGSVGLFLILAMVMFASKKIDWGN